MRRPEITLDETMESLGPYFFIQRKAGHRLTSDSVALASFAAQSLTDKDNVIDLGTATGAIPLILSYKTRVRHITGVEIDEAAAGTALRNVETNGLSERIEVIAADYRTLADRYPEGAFSAVISNPPYTKAGTGRISPTRERAAARSELFGGLPDLLEVSNHLAGKDGRIFFVFPVSRLSEMLEGAQKRGLKLRRLQFVHAGPGKEASLFLIELGRDGGFKLEEPLIL